MTYPCKRRVDIRSMGQCLYKNPGRPDISDSRQWRETSNFVLKVVAKVVPCEGYATENGWLIDIFGASGEIVSDYFVSVDIASSNLDQHNSQKSRTTRAPKSISTQFSHFLALFNFFIEGGSSADMLLGLEE